MSIPFSNTTTKEGAIQYCELYCNLGDAGISGNATLLKQFTGLINRANSEVWHLIFALNNGWKYDDSNQTGSPVASQTLVAGTAEYTLPAGSLAIDRIEVLNQNGTPIIVSPLRLSEIPVGDDAFYATDGFPVFYRLFGNTIKLYPAPAAANVTVVNGLIVYFERGSVAFASTATTATFGFASEYHEIVPRKASIEWLKVKNPDSNSLNYLIQDDIKRESELQEYEGVKFRNVKPTLRPKVINNAFR